MTFSGGAPAIGQATSGALASIVGAPLALLMGAVSCAAVIVGFAFTRGDLRDRDLGDRDPAPPPLPAMLGRPRGDAR
jgi:hypothetical protein